MIAEYILDKLSSGIETIIAVILILVIGYILIKIFSGILKRIFKKTRLDRTFETFVLNSINTVLWIIIFLMVMDKVGVDIRPILTSIGVAGFIIGFALKDTLSNFASGIMIVFYRPIKIGEYVEAAGVLGIVEEITMNTCKLRTFEGVRTILPNSKVWGNKIINYSSQGTTALIITLKANYETDMNKATKKLTKTVKKQELILKEPAPTVTVSGFDAKWFLITVQGWVKKHDFYQAKKELQNQIKTDMKDIVIV